MVSDVARMKKGMPVYDAGGETIGTIEDIWEPAQGVGPPPPMPGQEQPGEGYIHVGRALSETDLYVPFHEILQITSAGVRLAFGKDRADEYIGKPGFLG